MKGLMFLVAALALSGCVTRSSHTEGDRQVTDQTEKAGAVILESIEAAQAKMGEGKPDDAKTLLEIGARAGRDVVENAKQQGKVHGSPEAPLPYSPENSKKARDKSTQDHESGNWTGKVLGVLGALCGVAATLAGMPWLAPIFPALTGKIGKWATTGSQIITAVRAKAETQQGSIHIKDILEIAKEKNVSAGIQDLVTRHADAHEEAMGHAFEMKLADTAARKPATAEEGPK